MRYVLQFLPSAIYLVVALVSVVMARQCFLAKKLLPFQEDAARMQWDKVEEPLRPVIVSLLQLSGLGFLVSAFLLFTTIAVLFRSATHFERCVGPAASLVFSVGLISINLSLHRATKAPTPWKAAFAASILLVAGILVSVKLG
jgi:hypothetical protein